MPDRFAFKHLICRHFVFVKFFVYITPPSIFYSKNLFFKLKNKTQLRLIFQI